MIKEFHFLMEKNKMESIQQNTTGDVFKIIFRNWGVIFGGFLRDLIAGDKPRDIDCVFRNKYWDNFVNEMELAGYSKSIKGDVCIFTRDGYLEIDAHYLTDDCDCDYFGPVAIPDFDVNTLCYDGKRLYCWCSENQYDICNTDGIVKNIKNKTANYHKDSCDNDEFSLNCRRDKILNRGYTILNTAPKYKISWECV